MPHGGTEKLHTYICNIDNNSEVEMLKKEKNLKRKREDNDSLEESSSQESNLQENNKKYRKYMQYKYSGGDARDNRPNNAHYFAV